MTDLLDPVLRARFLPDDYTPSPLRGAVLKGVDIQIKDETNRMGLGAFKALGGIYAVGRLILQAAAKPTTPEALGEPETRAAARSLTFVCASAGNHGMAVAAGAEIYGARARIHLCETVPEAFAVRLRSIGAEVVRSGATYQESVTAAIKDAADTGSIHLADGSWPGYTEPPRLVMEGYTTIAEELRQSFEANGLWPTDVYLQAGVGGLAAAISDMIRRNWASQPRIIIVEPEAAPCIRDSIAAGKCVTVEGPDSNMGRLDCKSPSLLAFEILKEAADTCVTISDSQAVDAVAQLALIGVLSTPSGAAGVAGLLADPQRGARPLVITSEGALT